MGGAPKNGHSERGAALLLVSFMMVIVLVGGLAAVAVTSGELASSRGYRTRQITLSCANGGLERIRSSMPDVAVASGVNEGLTLNGVADAVTMRAGHYSSTGTPQASVEEVDTSDYDVSALFSGENITNVIGGGDGPKAYRATAVCEGSGYGAREVQIVVSYGTAAGAR